MIKTFGHQTIEKTNEAVSDRIKEGPVKSTIVGRNGLKKSKPPFAGDGYYFWEDSIEAADWWGSVHYTKRGKKYRIFRVDIDLRYDDNSFFDLIGNRQHLKFLGVLIEKTRKKIACDKWTLEQFITYFRLQEQRASGVFPFKMIRFNDYSLNPKIQQYIALMPPEEKSAEEKKNITLMNPFYIICVFDLNDIKLNTYTFIKQL